MIGLIVKYLFPMADMDKDVRIDNTGIRYWNEAKLGAQPTRMFLESKRADAEAFFAAQEAEKQKAQANSDLANHLVELSKMVLELRAKAEAKGETLTPVSAELAAKVAEIAEVVEEKP